MGLPTERLTNCALFSEAENGKRMVRDNQSMAWGKLRNVFTSGLACVGAIRIPGRGPRECNFRITPDREVFELTDTQTQLLEKCCSLLKTVLSSFEKSRSDNCSVREPSGMKYADVVLLSEDVNKLYVFLDRLNDSASKFEMRFGLPMCRMLLQNKSRRKK